MKIFSNIFSHRKRMFLFFFFALLVPLGAYSEEPRETLENQKISAPERGSPVDDGDLADFTLRMGAVKSGETLNAILKNLNVPFAAIRSVFIQSKAARNRAKIESGDLYYILSNPAPDRAAQYIVYEKSLLDQIVLDLSKSLGRYVGANRKAVSSLWRMAAGQTLAVELVGRLSDIYAGVIDFLHLRDDDGFKALVEEKYVGDKPAKLGRVKAARFDHGGKAFYAFYFEQDGVGNYYDENGQSLQRAFLKAPIKFARITSRFTKKRYHPVLKSYQKHLGIDYAAPAGTPVMAVGNGLILKKGHSKSMGRYIELKHNTIYMSQYLHLSRFAEGVKPGVLVKQGDIIGYVGRSGLTTGSNLDFRFWKNGKPVDYSQMDPPSGEPVKDELTDLFHQRIARLKKQLDADSENF